jgi:hypothetical protein
MSAMFLASILTLALLPPVIVNPPELEICIMQAELCANARYHCGYFDPQGLEQCIGAYEDCAKPFDEAHVPNCRVSVAWCALELPFSLEAGKNEEFAQECKAINDLCPSF